MKDTGARMTVPSILLVKGLLGGRHNTKLPSVASVTGSFCLT